MCGFFFFKFLLSETFQFQKNMLERRNSPHVDEKNESANEDDNINNENGIANSLNDKRSHQNMSDITNIQMQLDNIKV